MKKGILIGVICVIALVVIGVCVVLVIKGNSDQKEDLDRMGKNGENAAKEETKKINSETITCTGISNGVETVITYSVNTDTKEELINTMKYTINTNKTEEEICSVYESNGFKNCKVDFDGYKAVITVTPVKDVYKNQTMDDIKQAFEKVGFTCNIE